MPRQLEMCDDGVQLWRISAAAGGELYCSELIHDGRPFRSTWWSGRTIDLSERSTHFGYVHEGELRLECGSGQFVLKPGMYFSIPGRGRLTGSGSGHVISQADDIGLFHLGGPIESTGRLDYIDGCSDTLLIPPVIRGQSCLNLVHLPAHTHQSAHTHPSFRCGLVTSGSGFCRTAYFELPLATGTTFSIEAHAVHSFHTIQDSMRVIAFHPDSDFGPWHDDHPMVNRTLINGVAASRLSLAERRIGGPEPRTESRSEVS